jgi:hypothetical protein
LNRASAPRDTIKRAFSRHLDQLREWIGRQSNIAIIYISYNNLVERPEAQAERVREFLQGNADAASMARTVDPSLYRNRVAKAQTIEAADTMQSLQRDTL